jgi:hypothetical protein
LREKKTKKGINACKQKIKEFLNGIDVAQITDLEQNIDVAQNICAVQTIKYIPDH